MQPSAVWHRVVMKVAQQIMIPPIEISMAWYLVPGMAAAHYGHKREIDTSFPDGSDAQKQSVSSRFRM